MEEFPSSSSRRNCEHKNSKKISYVLLIFQVKFRRRRVRFGNILKPIETKNVPFVDWWVDDPKNYYTLSMVGK